mgnify:CR=1 FL=1
MTIDKDKVFSDPEEWRLELYRQHFNSIVETYKKNSTNDEIFI